MALPQDFLPNNLKQHPNLGQWLRFSNGKAQIFPGKVEIGQGIVTALIQIVTEELGLLPEQVVAMPASTSYSPNEAVTSGSLSVQECGAALRHVCALARSTLIQSNRARFATLLQAHQGQLQLNQGRLYHPNGTALGSYWDEPFASELRVQSCLELPTETSERRALGSLPRVDFPAKLQGKATFIQDMRLPNMRYSLVLRGAAKHEQVLAVRQALAREMSNLQMEPCAVFLEDGAFKALICDSLVQLTRYQGLIDQAIARNSEAQPILSAETARALNNWLESMPSEHTEVFRRDRPERNALVQAPEKALESSQLGFKATFDKPWLCHASIGLSCAIACFRPGESLQVWTHSQGIFNLRSDLFLALGKSCALIEAQFIVQHVEGAGCYGHNGADDVAFDAARVAISNPGIPIRMQWTRAQELSCAPFSPAMRVKVNAKLSNDTQAKIRSWTHAVWSNGHSLRPGRAATPSLLGSFELKNGTEPRVSVNATAAMGYGAERNALPLYDFDEVLIENYRLTEMPVRSSAFRGLGAIVNVFAIESMMDEVARHLNEDPLAFRLRHLQGAQHARARAVLNCVAATSAWKNRDLNRVEKRGSRVSSTMGYGIAFARYKNTGAWCAVVAKVALEERVRVLQIWIAADVGRVVNEDGVRNQLEGAAIQSSSIALLENAQFAGNSRVSPSWDDYPILKFSEVPVIAIDLINPRLPSSTMLSAETASLATTLREDPVSVQELSYGAGEPATAPVVAAIANAVADALGFPIRSLPLTPETIAHAIELS